MMLQTSLRLEELSSPKTLVSGSQSCNLLLLGLFSPWMSSEAVFDFASDSLVWAFQKTVMDTLETPPLSNVDTQHALLNRPKGGLILARHEDVAGEIP